MSIIWFLGFSGVPHLTRVAKNSCGDVLFDEVRFLYFRTFLRVNALKTSLKLTLTRVLKTFLFFRKAMPPKGC